MRTTSRRFGIILTASLLAVLGGCGGGGSSTPSSSLTVDNPPVATAPAVVGGATSLSQYQSYAFSTTTTDPDLGDSVVSCLWDFGDGTTNTVTTAPFTSPSHVFATAGSFTVSVTPTDTHGVAGAKVSSSFTVAAAANPFTLGAVSLSTTSFPIAQGSAASVTFQFTVTYAGTGTVSASGVAFAAGATQATGTVSVAAPASGATDGTGIWTAVVSYPAGTSVGSSYNATPSLTVTDSLGIQSLPLSFPGLTFTTVVANPQPPVITITSPKATSTQVYALETASINYSVVDNGTFPVSVSVDWGDGTVDPAVLLSGDALATGISPTTAPTHQYQAKGTYTVTVRATDTQPTTAQAKTTTYVVLENALPTATITSPQASGTLPTLAQVTAFNPSGSQNQLTLPAGSNYPAAVVIPLNGQLNFNGVTTNPTSGEAVSVLWSFPGGAPSSSTQLNAGSVTFAGQAGVIQAYLVELQAIDVFNRSSSQVGEGLNAPMASAPAQNTTPFRIWVIVDGVNTEQFTLNLMYRQLTDNNGAPLLTPATTAANGLGANIMIFQDGQSNSYAVQSANSATVTVPVRSNLPFYLNIPSFNSTDPTGYMIRIPNVTGQDPALEATLPAGSGASSFAFKNGNPVLTIVTGQGFAAETASTAQRRLACDVSGAEPPAPGVSSFFMVLGNQPSNNRWFDRLSVPKTDKDAIPTGFQTSNSTVGQFSGIPAYQSFAEWPIFLMSVESDFFPFDESNLHQATPHSPTTTAGDSGKLGFLVDYGNYGLSTAKQSDTYGVVGMQAYRVPASSQDPYDLTTGSPSWNLDSFVTPLQPTAIPTGAGSVPEFFNNSIFNNAQVSANPGGLQNFVVPYNTADLDRLPTANQIRGFGQLATVFSYAEYLWSSVWVRPLVLNNAQLYWGDSNDTGISAYPWFRYSATPTWPKWVGSPGILPDGSTFDLTANGGGVFDAQSPVSTTGTPDSKAVGRFYWTAFTPFYNSSSGAVISRTWLSAASGLPPTSFTARQAGEALSVMGFIPPQDTMVDKRGRDANGVLNGASLGGYRILWYNPTKDLNGNVVPPDFWVVEINGTNITGQGKTHFMLPASYPVPNPSGSQAGQATSDPILTDCRVYLPSGNAASSGAAQNDKVAPGYCWFDVPPELRPTAGSATITVFALKSILNNHPTGNPRPLNRTDWIDAIKTATSTISVKPSTGTDLGYVHKIPFNFGWDIVVVNGEATIVAP